MLAYDAASRVETITYPSGFAVKQFYTALGYLSEIRNNGTGASYWRADTANAEGQLTASTHGNGIATTRAYDANTGRLTTVQAGTGNAVQNLAYSYDSLGNLDVRIDSNQNVVENFDYDALSRLTRAEIVDGTIDTYQYDWTGNITSKSDVGSYTYPAPGAARPHAVSSIAGTVNTAYTYDDNGNTLTGNGRTLTWTAYNMAASIARGSDTLSFSYGPEQRRIRQVAPSGTTLYSDGFAPVEKFTGSGGATQWSNYIYAAGAIVAVYYEKNPGPSLTRYFHKDHLASVNVITDESGAVVERLAYDAWGKRRYPNGAPDPTESIISLALKGFTEHDHLPEVGLIEMNARVYDPQVARMLSADTIVPAPAGSQGHNRYSYVVNGPLSAIDPSGHNYNGMSVEDAGSYGSWADDQGYENSLVGYGYDPATGEYCCGDGAAPAAATAMANSPANDPVKTGLVLEYLAMVLPGMAAQQGKQLVEGYPAYISPAQAKQILEAYFPSAFFAQIVVAGIGPQNAVAQLNPSASQAQAPGIRVTGDIASYQIARSYLSGIPIADQVFVQAEKMGLTIDAVRGGITALLFDPFTGSRSVVWDPTMASGDKSFGVISPALSLLHEVAHAIAPSDVLRNGLNTMDPIYDNAEERRVITTVENPVAAILGEPVRSSHAGGPVRTLGDPTFHDSVMP